jgi:coproporphyrinogen III oxidase-like Fe-S oxidoreductase
VPLLRLQLARTKRGPERRLGRHRPPVRADRSRYLDALRADLEAALPQVWGRRVYTVFIGGGTPSLFSPDGIDRLLSDIRARLPLEPGAEITLEANPGTFEPTVSRPSAAGVNRLSIGVQSFDDAKLRALGRVHDRAQAIAAVAEAQRNFDTFNLDLMYALPGQTLTTWRPTWSRPWPSSPRTCRSTTSRSSPTRALPQPPKGLPDDDTAFDMLDHLIERTGGRRPAALRGVGQFARPGHRCVRTT